MKTQCCIEKLRQKLEERHGKGSEIDLELAPYLVESADKTTMNTELGYKPLMYSYKDGKKHVRKHIPLNFCPMCGKAAQ